MRQLTPGAQQWPTIPQTTSTWWVWTADDTDEAGIVDDETEVFGQRINAATGAEVGTNDFRISDAGGTGDAAIDAGAPAVAYNSTNNEYLVVWSSDDTDEAGILDGESEIFGQRINAATGAEVGTNDFRISDAGGTGDAAALWAYETAVAYNSTNNEYLVVWRADDTDTAGIVDGEQEIFGQRINAATGAEVGTNDFRISDAGGTGNAAIETLYPAVAYNSTNNEYLTVWHADDTDEAGILDNEMEIYGQRISLPTTSTTVIPTMPEWAMIIFMVLTGMMAVYYLKRIKIIN